MWKDLIVEEIHQYREAHAKKFNYDVWAIYEEMKAKEREYQLEGWQLVSFCASDSKKKEEYKND